MTNLYKEISTIGTAIRVLWKIVYVHKDDGEVTICDNTHGVYRCFTPQQFKRLFTDA